MREDKRAHQREWVHVFVSQREKVRWGKRERKRTVRPKPRVCKAFLYTVFWHEYSHGSFWDLLKMGLAMTQIKEKKPLTDIDSA